MKNRETKMALATPHSQCEINHSVDAFSACGSADRHIPTAPDGHMAAVYPASRQVTATLGNGSLRPSHTDFLMVPSTWLCAPCGHGWRTGQYDTGL